ncbi:MAG: AAA family ATPase [Opitutaceae bacterium]
MLLHFSVSNYRAFRGLQSLNLTASNTDKSLPQNLIEPNFPGVKNKRWLKAAGVYGANASGKSTLLHALEALADLVQNSAKTIDPYAPIEQIEPFGLDPKAVIEPTAFAVVFVNQGVRFEYRVAATRKRIIHESLRSFPKGPERLWFVRDWSEAEQTHIFSPESPAGLPRNRDIETRTLDNMLYLSKGIAESRKELDPAFRWFVKHLKFLNLSHGHDIGFGYTMDLLEKGSEEERQQILNILKHADLGIHGATSSEVSARDQFDDFDRFPTEVQEKILERRIKFPELLHKAEGDQRAPLPWNRESAGTKRFYSLVGPWLDILKNGYTVCIDELETSMHPIMVRELLKLFFNEATNPNNAQLVFTTHNPLLLDTTLIRRDQIWLTDKDNAGKAHLYPLTDYKPRGKESLVRGYMAGRYGAVPFIPDGLLGTSASVEVLPQREEALDE